MNDLDRIIINGLQGGFPLCNRPYEVMAHHLGLTESSLLDGLSSLLHRGLLTRFGPLFHAEKMGGTFSLVAMEVPSERFDEVTTLVNSFPEVAHNYERDHSLNMWFVIATERPERKDEVLKGIESLTQIKPIDLPKIKEYFVGLRLEV
jgi:DNA-binding Lrp family transcriptional regulator